MKQKLLRDIKFGEDVLIRLFDPEPVTYDQVVRSLGLNPKQVQKALADLCKHGYVMKLDRGYSLTKDGQQMLCLRTNGQEATT